MQLAVRTDAHVTHHRVLVATATAAVRLLCDPRCAPGGPWEPAVRRWQDGRIRKLVRRGRASVFTRATGVPGVSVELDGLAVHACVPAPTRPLPKDLDRLQVTGLELDPDSPHGFPPVPGPLVQVALTPHEPLSTGKRAAQAAHGAHVALLRMPPGLRSAWQQAGCPVQVAEPAAEDFDAWATRWPVSIRDAGFTETGGRVTLTCLARWLEG